jgi:hypothetical protein
MVCARVGRKGRNLVAVGQLQDKLIGAKIKRYDPLGPKHANRPCQIAFGRWRSQAHIGQTHDA